MKKTLLSLSAGMLIGSFCLAQNLVTNGGFELPDDGVKHLLITERTGWLSDDTKSNNNGTEYQTGWEGNYYQFCVNTAGTIYQPIDKIKKDSTIYNVSYLFSIGWNDDAGNDTVYSVVYFSHYTPGTDIKNRKLIDSVAIDVTSLLWNRQMVKTSFNIPANAAYVGDSLVIEFATRVINVDHVSNNTWTNMDSVVVSKSVVTKLPIVNPGFELPDDGKKHLFITERTGWFSDDAKENNNGTEYQTGWEGNYYQYCVNTAGTIYQPIDKITSDSASYKVSYLYSIGWNDDAGNDTVYSVVYFSHYTPGNDIKSRKLIDSVAIDVTSLLWNRQLVTATYKLPSNAAYAGDSLVVEFATRVINVDHVSNNTWTNMDSVVVFKTGKAVDSELIWKELNIATKVDDAHISNSADLSAKAKIAWDNKYIYMKLEVNDDLIYVEGDTATYNRDNVEVYFDLNNTKAALPKRGEADWHTSYNTLPGAYQLRLIPGIPFDSINNTRKGWAIQEYQVTETGYAYDLKFGLDSLLKDFVPEVGKQIGFDVLVSDNDKEPYYRDQLSFYAPSTTIWCDAAMWGTLMFERNGSFSQVFDVTKPAGVTDLVATKDVKNVKLTWNAATDNIVVEKYVVYMDNVKVATEFATLTDNSYVVENVAPGSHTFSVSALDIAGNESDKVEVSFTMTGVNNVSLSALKIFPNPSADYISFNNENSVKMELFNAGGQLVIVKSVNAGEKVDISALRKGIYSARVIDNNNVSVLKLIKK